MLKNFLSYLKAHHLLQPQALFLVACSGGIDSVVLCELCYQAGLRFAIAHCNFGLRGAESNRDETFVQSLDKTYNVRVFVKRFDTEAYGLLKKLSIQEAARELRYAWFESLRIEEHADYILLAHHANDNIETVLMNLFRGTGLHGLTGMPDQVDHSKCLRPMLQQSRKEIELFANENNLEWVEDSSNASVKYTRNFFRNELIPAIQKVYPQAEQNVLHTIERLKKTEALYQKLTEGVLKKLIVEKGNEYKIPINTLLQYAGTSLPYEVLKKFQFHEKQVAELLKLAQSESGSYLQNEQFRIFKHRNWFVISPHNLPQTNLVLLEAGMKKIHLPDGEMQVTSLSKNYVPVSKTSHIAQLDKKDIQFPIIVRRWKPGDYFYPLGLRKKKKLARFFIDLKLSLPDKEKVWVLESGSRIIWVAGYRIDDRFKITESTKNILQITFTRYDQK